jgi:serine phosphatase RsbU (regulator of sigma subunit)
MEAVKVGAIDWGVAGSVLPGQSHSGDQHVVCSFPDGVLIAVLDGLGHGEEAAAAARKAVSVVENRTELPLTGLAQRCHEELKTTRGVAMSMASFAISYGVMTWMGVGNVQGVLRRAGTQTINSQQMLLLRSGVVGIHLPTLSAASLRVFPGDILIFATDGIRDDFAQAPLNANTLQESAQSILARFSKGNDDALVLVARFLGSHT